VVRSGAVSADSGQLPRDDPFEFPERLGRYELLVPIASGGMAVVYLARSTGVGGFEREVAVKLIHAHLRDDPDFVTAILDEARLAGRIRHPNVVPVVDVGDDVSGAFIVMDYVEGDALSSIVRGLRARSDRVPLEIALRILDDTLRGLHAAHELTDADGVLLNVVHRDVTPHNILVGLDGVTRLTDFGIAKAAARLGNTSSGRVKGKIAYMSPEQARGQELDRTCDVWAAGVVAWELFAGRRLYDGANDAAVLMRVLEERPPLLHQSIKGIPPALDEALALALTVDAGKRYPSAEAFSCALAEMARGAGLAAADPRDVGRYLAPLVAPKLEQRRAKAREILRQRTPESSRSAVSAGTPGTAADGDGATIRELPSRPGSGSSSRARRADAARRSAAPESETVVGTTEELSASVPRQKRRPPWLVIGAAVALLLGVVGLASGVGRRNEPAGADETAQKAASTARLDPPPAPTVDRTPPPPSAEAVVAPEPGAQSARPEPSPSTRSAPGTSPRKSASKSGSAGTPLGNPYGAPLGNPYGAPKRPLTNPYGKR
jgi:eukaryotic-like serine/threonine-protein kinase